MYMDELSIYEKNLSQMLDNYEKAHTKYINELRMNTTTTLQGGYAPLTPQLKATASAIASLNQEIMFLIEEISSKINKINITSVNADIIDKKKTIINELNNKMRIDGEKINALLNDTIYLDGKNESILLQQKSSLYYLIFNTIIVIILGILFIRIIGSSETGSSETILLLLGVGWLFYTFRDTIMSWFYSITSYLSDTRSSLLANVLPP